MHKWSKRICTSALALVLLAAAMTVPAGAAGVEVVGPYRFNTDTGEITYAFVQEDTLTFPTTLLEMPVTGISDGASIPFYGTKIVVPEGYLRVGSGAFDGMPDVEEIILPNSVTELGESAMMGCGKLKHVTLPDSITVLPDYLFWQCYELEEITIPSTVTTIGVCAFGQTGITSLEIPRSVTTIAQSAFDMPKLTSLTIPDSVTTIGASALSNCDALTSFTWPASVPVIEDTMFRHCDSLQSVTIPATVTSMGDSVFQFCPKLTDIYYEGTQAQWESLLEGTTNYLDNVTVHFGAGDTQQPDGPDQPEEPAPSDQPSEWAAEQVSAAVAAGIVPESLQGKYTQAATRAEFCALAAALYETVTGAEITQRSTFSDTADPNVEKMAALGVVNGVGDGKFAPDTKLTREQAATMLARLAQVLGKPLAAQAGTFADLGSVSSWAADAVGQMQASGVMSGVGDNRFAPADDYTREQSILTMLRLFELVK